MDEYTPTYAEMVDAYTQMRVREAAIESDGERILTAIDALAEFERGMATRDRDVRAEALEQARVHFVQNWTEVALGGAAYVSAELARRRTDS